MEAAKASRTVHHCSALLSCDEKYSKHKLLTAQCAGLPFFNEKEKHYICMYCTVGAQCVERLRQNFVNCQQGNMSAHRRSIETNPWTAGVQYHHTYSNHCHEWNHALQAGAGSPSNWQLTVLTLRVREGARVGNGSTPKRGDILYVYSQMGAGSGNSQKERNILK